MPIYSMLSMNQTTVKMNMSRKGSVNNQRNRKETRTKKIKPLTKRHQVLLKKMTRPIKRSPSSTAQIMKTTMNSRIKMTRMMTFLMRMLTKRKSAKKLI